MSDVIDKLVSPPTRPPYEEPRKRRMGLLILERPTAHARLHGAAYMQALARDVACLVVQAIFAEFRCRLAAEEPGEGGHRLARMSKTLPTNDLQFVTGEALCHCVGSRFPARAAYAGSVNAFRPV